MAPGTRIPKNVSFTTSRSVIVASSTTFSNRSYVTYSNSGSTSLTDLTAHHHFYEYASKQTLLSIKYNLYHFEFVN